MNILKKINNHPNQFLYYELLIETWYIVVSFTYWHLLQFTTLELICTISMIIMIGAMGLVFPQKAFHEKIYWIAQLCILSLPYISNNFIYLPFLSTVVFLRGYQIYGIKSVRYLSILLILFMIVSNKLVKSGFTQAVNSSDISYIHFYMRVSYVFWQIIGITLIIYMIGTNESKKKLNIALDQIKKYSIQIQDQAIILERNRIARDIHDALGHNLTAQNIQLESGLLLLQNGKYNEAINFFSTSKELCLQSLKDVRQTVSNIKDVDFDVYPFENVIMQLIKDFQQTSGIEPNFLISVEDKLPAKISNTIYRILQECLTNILRHSQATEVSINIISQNEILYFSVEDNGKGFNLESKNQGHGLLGIQDRVNNFNGQFSLITEPNNGCQINININIKENK